MTDEGQISSERERRSYERTGVTYMVPASTRAPRDPLRRHLGLRMKALESQAPSNTEMKLGNESTTVRDATHSVEREKKQGIPDETSKVAKIFTSKESANIYFSKGQWSPLPRIVRQKRTATRTAA